jgi:hypothetical protein
VKRLIGGEAYCLTGYGIFVSLWDTNYILELPTVELFLWFGKIVGCFGFVVSRE